jgi:cobalt/nickel transport system permease protein
MTLAFAQVPTPDSPLRRLDPRWKLAGLGLAVVAAALLRTLPAAGAALAASLVLAAAARLPLRWYLARLGMTALFLAPFVLTLPFLLPGPGGELPSRHGAGVALLLALKAATLVTLALVLLAGAPLSDTLKAAHALWVPGLLVHLFVLAYRYAFLLGEELARLRVALRVRGYRNRPDRHSYRTIGHVAGTLLVRSHERGERVGQAMRCRGFDGRFRSLTAFHTTLGDVGFFLLMAAGSVGIFWWDLGQRF